MGIRRTLQDWKPKRVLIENAHHGPPLAAELNGFNTELISTSPGALRGDSGKPGKLERATQLLNKLEKGEVFLPRFNNSWLPELESEWLTWTGMEDETSDQVDAAAYAARHSPAQQVIHWDGPIYLRNSRGNSLGWNWS